MSEKKHIDRLFQEKFKDFEVSPDPNVWHNIERELKGKKKRRAVFIPLWFKIAGSAAVLALVLWMGSTFLNKTPRTDQINIATEVETRKDVNSSETEKPIKKQESKKTNLEENNISKRDAVSEEAVVALQNSAAEQQGNKQTNTDAESMVETADKNENILSEPVAINEQNKEVEKNKNSDIQSQNDLEVPASVEKQKHISPSEIVSENISVEENVEEEEESNKKSLLAYAAAQQEEKEDELESNISPNKWEVQPFAAPVYYKGGNAIDPKFASNPIESDITMAYGVNLAYQVSKKLKIRSGIGQVKISNNIQDIIFTSGVEGNTLAHVNYNQHAEVMRVETSGFSINYSEEVKGRGVPLNPGTLNQQMGFIEVPLEIEYSLIDKKFGLSIIGGGSTLFLSENSISINSAQGTTNIGEANNLNKTSFSTNIGLGLDYKLSNRFELNLEPTFKYQINTFTDGVDFNPYYFGVFTGVNFKF